jgi:hypothetical protein
MKDIREDEAWWSPVGYTVDNFWFEEEGAVLGDANEFVNHSRLLWIARGRSGGTERKDRDERPKFKRTWWRKLVEQGKTTTRSLYSELTHNQTTTEPAHHASVAHQFPS